MPGVKSSSNNIGAYMPTSIERDQLIKKIVAAIAKQVSKPELKLISQFVAQYFWLQSYEDLRQETILNLAGLVLNHWRYIQNRKVSETKLRIFNPTVATHGWQSAHTVIELAHDDMPFLVDSLRMAINRHHLGIHFIIHTGGMKIKRDKNNSIAGIYPRGTDVSNFSTEAPIHIEIDRTTDPKLLKQLEIELKCVLTDVANSAHDWQLMQDKLDEAIRELSTNPPLISADELQETIEFLHWLKNNNFTFLGYRDYDLIGSGAQQALSLVDHSSLGVLRDLGNSIKIRKFTEMPAEVKRSLLAPQALTIAKTNTESTVHRPVYTDFISIKRFSKQGKLIGEHRFVGLFTSSAYNTNPQSIPYLRLKLAKILTASGLVVNSHAYRTLLNILETFPRDDLFQESVEALCDIALSILNLQERNVIRLFARKDIYNRYVSSFVYMPKHRYTHELQKAIQNILEKNFNGKQVEYHVYFDDSNLARLHHIIRTDGATISDYDLPNIEKQITEAAASWSDALKLDLLNYCGEERALKLFQRYGNAFPASYRERVSSMAAVTDIKHMEQLDLLLLNLYCPKNSTTNQFNLKIYQLDHSAPLSDTLPILENMGMRVLDEHPYEIKRSDGVTIWIDDFSMQLMDAVPVDLDEVKENFEQAFYKSWFDLIENDMFNRLVISAQLDWRQISLLRALSRYLRQVGVPYSQTYIEETFTHYPQIAKMFVELFNLRFNPELATKSPSKQDDLQARLNLALDAVTSLDEDKILRLYLTLLTAMLRTNYYVEPQRTYMSFKFDSSLIPELPKPRPLFEVFVYSPRFEAIHLRGGKVARGGIRWSDRREDFRTEVLGLMKAQQVKNSVIVPTGAKGGFVLKKLEKGATRQVELAEAKECYQNFIRALLDITDNYVGDAVVAPKDVVRYDENDPYLVVAADKGTATFSDLANHVSAEYKFWLGDAFASGGKTGYDHKKMAITAQGAWISATRHFQLLGVDINKTDITVTGIGDMAGDVFGNGMLLSKHLKLVAAFNHQHIFIDPTPDPKKSYAERKRLFNLPQSSWMDYDAKLISTGGGVFSRQMKVINLSPEIKTLLNLTQDTIEPNELIRAVLRAEVDLLWNGGIGTFVKAGWQTNADAGDRSSDALRINASELRCRVVAEGGNLGFTQAARIEYALRGGKIYTDFIDNSAGVDCSDKEVNIKILLSKVVEQGLLDLPQRDRLLSEMTDEVASIVLYDNYRQTQIVEITRFQVDKQIDLLGRFIAVLEEEGTIERTLESLPTNEQLIERKAKNENLTSPEIAVLVSYSKILLKNRLLKTDLADDPCLAHYLATAFPKRLTEQYGKQLAQHRLRREIIITQVSNDLVNEMGPVYIYRMYSETGAAYTDIVRAYVAARDIFNLDDIMRSIQALDFKVKAEVQLRMMVSLTKLVRRASRWLIRRYRTNLNISTISKTYKANIQKISQLLPDTLIDLRKDKFERIRNELLQAGVPQVLALQIASCDALYSAMDIVEAARSTKLSLQKVADAYDFVGYELHLNWLRYQMREQKNETLWEGLALAAIFDDIDLIQRNIATNVLSNKAKNLMASFAAWQELNRPLYERWCKLINTMRAGNLVSPAILYVGLHELSELAQIASI
ncbi:MAG: NAD-glutamate dehydrogenase [Gammaproteobacteria bacterium]|nr:NAD-glutamate dehydrogenase [Gammaproteobacteria bacterium]